MKGVCSALIGVLAVCLFLPPVAAQDTNAPVDSRSFAAFKLLHERNIFNQNRRPGVKDTPRKETPRAPRIDRFSLVGTLIHEQGSFAFFDGSESSYQTVIKPDQTIGGCKVMEIAPESVKLQSGTNSVELFMGMQMKREDEGAWQAVMSSTSSSASSDTSKSSSTEESTGDAAADAILKRLMEKREKELNK